MAAREKYARCSFTNKDGVEFILGVEIRDGDKWIALRHQLKAATKYAVTMSERVMDEHGVWIIPGDYDAYATAFETLVTERWPGRAYFVEVGVDDAWVQLFQPYGVPRAA